ncbi:MAG: DUF3263 domain-containing protein [Micrococcus sp.]|nr:DUF3263 domain-containing protein [Micrococcus sp.]
MPAQPPEPLTERERRVLELESQRWRYSGAKDQAIRDRLNLTPTAYYQILTGLLDREAAVADRPLLVKRLRARRTTVFRAERPTFPRPTPAQEN